jgi:hypothetical protein
MSKFEMSAPNKKRESVITPEIVYDVPQKTTIEKKSSTPAKSGKTSEILSQKNITSVLEIAKIIVQEQAAIAKIHANTEAEIQKIESEIKKIIVSTQSEIAKMREENSNWHSKFDARQQAVQKTLEFLETHPEYSDDVKKCIIQLAIAEIEKQ